MNAFALATLALLVTSSLGGCLDRSTPPEADRSVPTAAPGGAPSTPAAPMTASSPGVRAVAVAGTLVTPGDATDNLACYPTDPGVCRVQAHERVFSTGSLNGTWTDAGIIQGPTRPSATLDLVGRMVFWGSIEGCGSGTLSMTYTSPLDLRPSPDGTIFHGVDNLSLVPGSPSIGLANVVGLSILLAYDLDASAAGKGEYHGTVWCGEPVALPTHAGAHEVEFLGTFTNDGAGNDNVGGCDESGRCTYYSEIFLDAAGGFAGRIHDIFAIQSLPGETTTVRGFAIRLFTGDFGECGSGTLAMTLDGRAPIEPNPTAGNLVHFREPTMQLLQGTQSTGLAGLVDGTVTLDFNISRSGAIDDGTVKAHLWCGAPTTRTGHEGATEIPITGTLTTDGTSNTDEQRCDPTRPGVCEVYETQLVELKGTMTGEILDMAHLHANSDGSITAEAWRVFTGTIDGCGSGVFELRLKGSATVAPSAGKPGKVHLKEPPSVMVPGSTSVGFAGLVAGTLTLEGDFYGGATAREGDATVSGSVWCTSLTSAAAAPPPHPGPTPASDETLGVRGATLARLA